MAPSLLAAAAASPFLVAGSSTSRRPLGAAPTRRAAGLRVAALKYDPAKVGGLGAVTEKFAIIGLQIVCFAIIGL
jgi:chaperonin GroES